MVPRVSLLSARRRASSRASGSVVEDAVPRRQVVGMNSFSAASCAPADSSRARLREPVLLDAVPVPHPVDVDVQRPLSRRVLVLPRAARGVTGPVLLAIGIGQDAAAGARPDEHVA